MKKLDKKNVYLYIAIDSVLILLYSILVYFINDKKLLLVQKASFWHMGSLTKLIITIGVCAIITLWLYFIGYFIYVKIKKKKHIRIIKNSIIIFLIFVIAFIGMNINFELDYYSVLLKAEEHTKKYTEGKIMEDSDLYKVCTKYKNLDSKYYLSEAKKDLILLSKEYRYLSKYYLAQSGIYSLSTSFGDIKYPIDGYDIQGDEEKLAEKLIFILEDMNGSVGPNVETVQNKIFSLLDGKRSPTKVPESKIYKDLQNYILYFELFYLRNCVENIKLAYQGDVIGKEEKYIIYKCFAKTSDRLQLFMNNNTASEPLILLKNNCDKFANKDVDLKNAGDTINQLMSNYIKEADFYVYEEMTNKLAKSDCDYIIKTRNTHIESGETRY